MFNGVTKKIYSTWDELYRCSNVCDLPWVSKDIHPVLKKEIDGLPVKNGNALDVGCGLGQVSRYLAKVGFTTTAIDISDEAIRLCKGLNDTGKSINYIKANSTTFNEGIKYDLIVDFLHIHDIQRRDIRIYLKNIESQLSKNGYVIISTFLTYDEAGVISNSRKSYFVDQDVNYYSKGELLSIFSNKYLVISSKPIVVGKKDHTYNSYILILKIL